jgi:hypothetical protein
MKTAHPLQSVLIALTVLAGPPTSTAEDGPRVRIGFDGSYKVGFWTPIAVDFGDAGDSATCRVIVPDADRNETIAPLDQVADGRFAGVFRSGRLNAAIRVQAGSRTCTVAASDEGDEPDASPNRPAQQFMRFLGVVGSGELIETAVAKFNETEVDVEDDETRARLIRFPDWSALPPSGPGWDALDVLFLTDTFPDTAEQSEALRNWVRRGGHLVLSLGDRNEAFQSSPLPDWVPARIDGTRTVNELAIIGDKVPGAQPLPARAGIVAARLDTDNGEVLLSTFEGPLAVRFAYGIGRVTVLAVDYMAPPMSEWDGRPQFCLILAGLDVDDEAEPATQSRMSGVSDLATQMAAGLDWFPAVARPSYRTVLVALLCFLLIVGPLDYFLVHRLLKRPRRTWITFPLAVLAAAGCGAVVARQAHPQQPLANQLDIVDLDVSLSTTHVRSWAALYSPAPRRQAVEFVPAAWVAGDAGPAPRVSWFGKPEDGFRGIYRRGGVDLGNPEYEYAPGYASILNLPIDQWSTKTLSAEWEQQRRLPVQNNLLDDGTGELSGSLTHHLPAPIDDWMLAYGGYVYFARDDAPESEVSIAPGVPLEPAEVLPVPRLLQRVLVGGHSIVIDRGDAVGGDTSTPGRRSWDPLDRDPLQLVRMITFHEAAGGREYTGLTNSTLARSDLSHLLPLHRAVLLGRITGPGLRLAGGEEPEVVDSSTFVRIILPVRSAASADGG